MRRDVPISVLEFGDHYATNMHTKRSYPPDPASQVPQPPGDEMQERTTCLEQNDMSTHTVSLAPGWVDFSHVWLCIALVHLMPKNAFFGSSMILFLCSFRLMFRPFLDTLNSLLIMWIERTEFRLPCLVLLPSIQIVQLHLDWLCQVTSLMLPVTFVTFKHDFKSR